MTTTYQPRKGLLISLVTYSLLIKVLPFLLVNLGLDIRSVSAYPWSYTPIFAIGLFGIATFRDAKLGYGIVLTTWLLADVIIGFSTGIPYGSAEGMTYSIYAGQAITYAAAVVACSCGWIVRRWRNWGTIIGVSLLAPTLFFLVSNWGVWRFDIGIGYPRNGEGLMQAYVAGLVFYRAQLVSTTVCSILLFGRLGTALLEGRAEEVRDVKASAAINVQS